jgi:Ser/Thr protein kinase RdoA (MazF antagonist)
MEPQLVHIVQRFRFEGDLVAVGPLGGGHINDTYLTRYQRADGASQRYVLQRINHSVFKDPAVLMQNIEAVTTHLRHKIVAAGGDPERETLNLIPTRDGATFARTPDGQYWRAYGFIAGARTYHVVEDLQHVYSAARAFGRFQEQLSDLPADRLHETIPDFHHTGKRYAAFVQAVERDAVNRARSVAAEIEFVARRADETSVLVDLLERGVLPERVTHNDTKLNNVLIDDLTGEGICVIDLDTVMPGLSLYDFGDCVRSAANPAAEDERDLSKVCVDLSIFERLVQGYLDTAWASLTPAEIELLPFAAKLITLEQGIRFLADHLNGDVYYKIQREGHNLDRCRTQLKLVADIEDKFGRMRSIVSETVAQIPSLSHSSSVSNSKKVSDR